MPALLPLRRCGPPRSYHHLGIQSEIENPPADSGSAENALMPPISRLKERLDDHIHDEQPRYVREPLFRVDAKRVTHDPGYVTKYALKALTRLRINPDQLIVLPRALSELTRA